MRKVHASYTVQGEVPQRDRLVELLAIALAARLKKPARAGLIPRAPGCSMSDMDDGTDSKEITYSNVKGHS